MLIDLHTHTYPESDDSYLSPEELIREAQRVGLDAICITDHDRFWTPEAINALSREFNFLVIPGCEVTTEEGHLLVYGLDHYIFGMHRASFVQRLVEEASGAIVVAHPYRRRYREEEHRDPETGEYDPDYFYERVDRACAESVFPRANAVEVFNGRGSPAENAFSWEVQRRFGLPGTAASDAHRLEDIGTFATEFERSVACLQDLITELRAGRYRPVILEKRRDTGEQALLEGATQPSPAGGRMPRQG